MIHEKIALSDTDAEVYLETFVPAKMGEYRRKALLVIPGGGYRNLSEREGEPIGEAFIPYGFAAFVLHYSVNRKRPFPAQLIEASKAIMHIKANAKTYGIDPEAVFVVGFSAGGHLAASIGTLYDHPEIYKALPMKKGENKPKGVILAYPVITAGEKSSHKGSVHNLLCTDTPTSAQLEMISLEKHVTKDTVPMFMMHTAEDATVSVQNSLVMAEALNSAGVPFELHIFPKGKHGMALGNAVTAMESENLLDAPLSRWVEMAAAWTARE